MDDPETTSEPRLAGRREWAGLAVLALPLLVLSLDITVLYLAAPQLAVDLRPTATESLWILDAYGFLIAGFLLTMGTLGDRIGRRRLLLIGGAAFAVASVLAAFAPTAGLLIAARALLGVAGATLMPSTLALISTMFPDRAQRTFAIAVWMTTFSAGAALGPLVGGLVLEWFWWGAVFLLGVPVMAVLLVLGPLLLPEHRDRGAGRPDLPSVALSLGAMLPLVYGVKQLAAYGPDPVAAVAVVAGVAVGVLFVRRQRRLPDPMLDVSLFTRRAFAAAVGLMLFGLLAANGIMFLLPQYLQLVAGLPPLVAGVWLLPLAVAGVLGGLATPRLAARFGAARLIGGAAVGSAAAMLGLAAVIAPSTPLPLVVGLASVAVTGIAPVTVLGTDLVVGSVPPARAGSAAAVSETAGELGVALGVAVTGSVVAAVYGSLLVLPAGLPDGVAAAARDGLGTALAAATEVPADVAGVLAAGARAAFSSGFAAAGLVGAGLLAVVVALSRTLMTDAPPPPAASAAPSGRRRA